MAGSAFENLDLACADCGRKIGENPSKDLYKKVTNALSVLTDQGLYALFLFLDKSNQKSPVILKTLRAFLKNEPKNQPLLENKEDVFKEIALLSQNIDNLILANELAKQTLVYARYHAKRERNSEVIS
jgi:hypothetical protein